MADVTIPREAVEAAARQIHTGFDRSAPIEQHNAREAAMAALNAAAPLIVAAELERFIPIVREICGRQNEPDYNEDFEDGWDSALAYFVARAEQLRAQS